MATRSKAHEPWLFVIVGTTGSGKTKLSLDLAEALDRNLQLRPEIVSADSMQVYKHIDILSAKATVEEQVRVPHHLLSMLELDDNSFSVGIYQKMAKERIAHLQTAPHVPILVGGTNYYVEAVIWDEKYTFEPHKPLDPAKKAELDEMDAEALHALLATVDPERATLLHPNARRKVLRSLEIFYTSGKPHSEVVRELKSKSKLAYERTCVFWVACDKEVLDERLDKRVDDMVSGGLKEELRRVVKYFEDDKEARKIDWERGAFQSIGLREFRPWIEKIQSGEGEDEQLYDEAVAQVKLHSRQYARSQISWIKNGLCPATLIYKFNSTDPKKWYESIFVPASEIACKLMRGESMQSIKEEVVRRWSDDVQVLDNADDNDENEGQDAAWKKYDCEFCHKTLNGLNEWNAHLTSKGHKAARKRHFKPIPAHYITKKNKPPTSSSSTEASTGDSSAADS